MPDEQYGTIVKVDLSTTKLPSTFYRYELKITDLSCLGELILHHSCHLHWGHEITKFVPITFPSIIS